MCIYKLPDSPPEYLRPPIPSYLDVCSLRLSRQVTSRATDIPKLLDHRRCKGKCICVFRSKSLVSNVSVGISVAAFFLFILFMIIFMLSLSIGKVYDNGNSGTTMLFTAQTTTLSGTVPTFGLCTITEELRLFFLNSLLPRDEWNVDWWPQLQSPFVGATASNATVKVTRPAVLTFAVLVDPVRIDAALESVDGILAAFKEANTNDTLYGTKLEIDVFDVRHLVDQVRTDGKYELDIDKLKRVFSDLLNNITDRTTALANYKKEYYGIIDLTDTVLQAYKAVYANPKDFIFITSGLRTANDKVRKDTLFFKPSFNIEKRQLVEVMVHRSSVYCGTTIFFFGEGKKGSSSAWNKVLHFQFLYSNLNPPTILTRPNGQSSFNLTAVKNALSNIDGSCFLIDDTIDATHTLMKGLLAGQYGEFNRDKYNIFVTSRSIRQGVVSYPPYFKGVYTPRLFPDSRHSQNLYHAFESSLKAFRGSYTKPNYINLPGGSNGNQVPSGVPSLFPTPAAYLGYIIGGLLSQVASLSYSLESPGALLDIVYTTRSFLIHNFGLGPFTDKCVGGVKNPCLCNVAIKSIYTGYIDPISLSMKEVHVPSYERDTVEEVTKFTISSDVCMSKEVFLDIRAYNFMLPMKGTGSLDLDAGRLESPSFSQILYIGLIISNRDKDYSNKLLKHVKHGFLTVPPTEDDITAIDERYRPFLLFENDHYGVVTNNSLTLTRRSSEWRIKEEPFNPSRLILEPSLGDAIHANLAAMKDFSKGSAKTFLLAETEEQLELMKASAAALGISVSGSKVIGSSEEEHVKREVEAAADAVKSEKSGISYVHYASQSVTFAFQVATTRRNLFLFLSTPERAIEDANKTSITNKAGSPFADNTRVFFATAFGRWWYPSSGLHRIIIGSLNATGSRMNILHSEITAVQAALSVSVGGFLAEAAFKLGYRSNAMDALRENPFISIPGVAQIGPLGMDECTNKDDAKLLNRECSCNKAFRKLTVAEVGDWLTKSPQSYFATLDQGSDKAGDVLQINDKKYYYFQYEMDGCGIDYNDSQWGAVIGGIAAAGALLLLLLIGVLVFIFCFKGRSHGSAPKDSTMPFAVLFTDIDSSTALWSRAPAAASLSVDVHHELMRKQISLHRGYEVKTVGESFMVAFKKPENAVAFAVDVQRSFYANVWPEDIDFTYRSLAFEDADEATPLHPIFLDENAEDYKKLWNGIRVRIGVHYGFGNIKKDEVTEGYDYYGTVVNTAARVQGVGHGGQVLITEDVYTSLSETFLSETINARAISLNKQFLRGLDEPTHLYQVMPHELIDRHFNPLRLNVERTVDTDGGEMGDSCSLSQLISAIGSKSNSCSDPMLNANDRKSSQPTSMSLMPESVAEKLQVQYRNAFHRDDLLKFYNFLKFANVSCTPKYREDLISHWGKKWNVAIKKPKKAEHANEFLMYNSLQVIAKITASYFDNIKSKRRLNAGSRLSGASGTRGSFTDSLLPLPHSISDMGSIGNNSITVMNFKKISDGGNEGNGTVNRSSNCSTVKSCENAMS